MIDSKLKNRNHRKIFFVFENFQNKYLLAHKKHYFVPRNTLFAKSICPQIVTNMGHIFSIFSIRFCPIFVTIIGQNISIYTHGNN